MSVSLSLFPGQTVSDSIVRVQQALAAMREGTPVILMDDFDRENEADLIIAAEKITDRTMALLIRECSGIVCLCLPDEALQRLKLPAMVDSNESRYGTAFTISIEARQGVTTGVSVTDRVTTIRAAIADDAQPEHLARPGAAARDWRHFLGAARAVQPRRFQSSGIRLKALGSATLSGSRRVRDSNRDCAY